MSEPTHSTINRRVFFSAVVLPLLCRRPAELPTFTIRSIPEPFTKDYELFILALKRAAAFNRRLT